MNLGKSSLKCKPQWLLGVATVSKSLTSVLVSLNPLVVTDSTSSSVDGVGGLSNCSRSESSSSGMYPGATQKVNTGGDVGKGLRRCREGCWLLKSGVRVRMG